MAINLGQLRAFDAVARTGSFTRAAHRLGVTPPAVSLQIRQLEQAHGVRLFDRLRRRVCRGETQTRYDAAARPGMIRAPGSRVNTSGAILIFDDRLPPPKIT